MEEIPSILWSYCTTPREGTGMTPFHLVYGEEAVAPIKIRMPSTWANNVEKHSLELDLVEESHDKAIAQLRTYKQ